MRFPFQDILGESSLLTIVLVVVLQQFKQDGLKDEKKSTMTLHVHLKMLLYSGLFHMHRGSEFRLTSGPQLTHGFINID